jgi:hypothetical protein
MIVAALCGLNAGSCSPATRTLSCTALPPGSPAGRSDGGACSGTSPASAIRWAAVNWPSVT